MQAYSSPKRESDPYSLPDVEIFEITSTVHLDGNLDAEDSTLYPGWYWQSCFPGCLPDSDPIGPFETEEAALADAQSEAWQFEEE